MTARLTLWNCVAVSVLSIASLAGDTFTAVDTHEFTTNLTLTLIGAPFTIVFAALAHRIVLHWPDNVLGPVFAGLVLAIALVSANESYLTYALEVRGGSMPGMTTAAWISEWSWAPALLPVTFLFLLTPNGKLPSRRWRPVGFAIGTVIALVTAGTMLTPYETRPELENPYQIDALGPLPELLLRIGLYGIIPSMALSGWAMVVRYRRSRGIERQQLKFIASAGACSGVLWVLALVAGVLSQTDSDLPYAIALAVSVVGTALAVALAVLRYRLYDIDILINRTLVYGGLTAGTVGSYAVLVVALGWVARAISGQEGNEVVVAATTLIVAALFQPARRRIQALVDRRFYRSRYDAGRTLEAFQARLRDELDIESLQRELAATVHAALRPSNVRVWLRHGAAE